MPIKIPTSYFYGVGQDNRQVHIPPSLHTHIHTRIPRKTLKKKNHEGELVHPDTETYYKASDL